MSTTLNFADRLLARARHLERLGREQDAVRLFHRLAGFPELPPTVSEEAKARLAEILVRRGRFVRARRHLGALIHLYPGSAHYHYLMATALSGDERSDPRRAAEHYRKSLELDPAQPQCLGEYGLFSLRMGDSEGGLELLRRATELAPDEPAVIARLAEGLRLEGQVNEARDVLRSGRFRHPRDPRFVKLWNDFQFQQLHEAQQRARRNPALVAFEANRPRLLPFERPAGYTARIRSHGKIIRSDAPAALQPPRIGQPDALPDQKHA